MLLMPYGYVTLWLLAQCPVPHGPEHALPTVRISGVLPDTSSPPQPETLGIPAVDDEELDAARRDGGKAAATEAEAGHEAFHTFIPALFRLLRSKEPEVRFCDANALHPRQQQPESTASGSRFTGLLLTYPHVCYFQGETESIVLCLVMVYSLAFLSTCKHRSAFFFLDSCGMWRARASPSSSAMT